MQNGMNFVAFVLVVAAGVIGAIEVVTSNWKSLTGWALITLAAGVLIQEVATSWSHTIHA